MNLVREHGHLRFAFNAIESRVLQHILETIAAGYKVAPAEIDPKVAAVWYSTRGCETSQMSTEETREWVQQIHGLKSAHVALLEEWVRQLTEGRKGHHELRVHLEQTPALVNALNDHRLHAAARNDIGQAEMDLPPSLALKSLSPAQQLALFEIHLLAGIIEEILRITAPEATGWMDQGPGL
jgi:hypothetical protein